MLLMPWKIKQNKQYKVNTETLEWIEVNFGSKSLKVHGPKIWNSLFFQIKSALHLTANLTAYKSWMKNKNNNSCFVQVAQIKSFISSIFLYLLYNFR